MGRTHKKRETNLVWQNALRGDKVDPKAQVCRGGSPGSDGWGEHREGAEHLIYDREFGIVRLGHSRIVPDKDVRSVAPKESVVPSLFQT